MRLLAALVVALMPGPALAGLTAGELARVAFAPPPQARVPLAQTFRDGQGRAVGMAEILGGRPALLLPLDYQCRETCAPAATIVAGTLAGTGLQAGSDFRLVLVGLRPAERPEDGGAFARRAIADPAILAATTTLTGDAAAIDALTTAIGYSVARDSGNDAIAHPTALIALAPDGRAVRALSTLALDATDLRLAIVEAGEGRVGGITAQLRLLCYGFDPVHGIYTSRIMTILQIAGALTSLLLAGWIAWLIRRGRAQRGAA